MPSVLLLEHVAFPNFPCKDDRDPLRDSYIYLEREKEREYLFHVISFKVICGYEYCDEISLHPGM